ncbi:alpha/beta hydrolase [Corynebacterium lowii]|uniref:Diacylglycerol acyltransferase/mycolyltransferase Ag85A n=1 Tax=Corynebacterium lowii TaxID=1544413 RepID=A0A0Q0YLZ2_9CORY|nr:alpha/beta hydrolase family protein [Corynebacterium lowii]KQB83464.1 Diacylglycerol acyltransferase/mycolyltransferase Ag85A precursor [Corynebacterium lowii]MDP9852510.1 diacylglycerol O-acyltransferase/trehalose O-mycolyltransferase [Corynebacterium lowii]
MRSAKTWARAQMDRTVAAVMAVVIAAVSLMVVGPVGEAHAGNRDWLRPDSTGTCEWDPNLYWIQRCDVWSPSMNKHVPVQIRPSSEGGNGSLYLLDGLLTEGSNSWSFNSNVRDVFNHTNITLVMPTGGRGSFYADWEAPASLLPIPAADMVNPDYRYETFLTQELPPYLEANFGVSRSNNSVMGISMGATGAMNLAAKHPDQFKQVFSLSGYLTLTVPGSYAIMGLVLLSAGGFNINNLYGSVISPKRAENDPYMNMEGLRNTDVVVVAGSGIARGDDPKDPQSLIVGGALEQASRISTQMWGAKARGAGLVDTEIYPEFGIHNWPIWNDMVNQNRDRILRALGA